MTKWISVKDSLPVIKMPYGIELVSSPEDMTIVIARAGNHVFPAQVYYDGFYDDRDEPEPVDDYVLDDTVYFFDLSSEETILGVTHWQPLPNPEDA